MNQAEIMEIEKLKVADLRQALGGRGLDTKGTKPILVQRLRVSYSFITVVKQHKSQNIPLIFNVESL